MEEKFNPDEGHSIGAVFEVKPGKFELHIPVVDTIYRIPLGFLLEDMTLEEVHGSVCQSILDMISAERLPIPVTDKSKKDN